MEVLQFMFSGFWTFVGCMMALGLIVRGIVALASIIRGIPVKWGD